MDGRIVLSSVLRRDVVDGGESRIPFTTKDENGALYGPKRVRLLDRYSGRLLREAWSDPAGSGAFDWVAYRPQGYTVIACNNRRANGDLDYPDIEDFVTPEPMP